MIYIVDSGFKDLPLEYSAPSASNGVNGDHGYMLYTVTKSINRDEEFSFFELGSSPTVEDIIQALDYLDSISQGGIILLTVSAPRSPELDSKIQEMINKNIFHFVVSAGNRSLPIKDFSPAAIKDVITVGSLNKAGEIASHNNTGDIDLYAPGTNINVNGKNYSGTSVAAAIVAGFWGFDWNVNDVRVKLQANFQRLIHHQFSLETYYDKETILLPKEDANGAINVINAMRGEIDNISPSYCLAKWLQVTLHLQNGRTHSCHHPRTHHIPLAEIQKDPSALHNTEYKKQQRKKMIEGERPSECQYCWNVEDMDGDHISDRYWKSLNGDWSLPYKSRATKAGWQGNVTPSYVEVSFSNACNFKCSYCSPVHSSQWVNEIRKEGPYKLSGNRTYNGLESFIHQKEMPIHHKEENPYVEAFWKWWPELSEGLRVFRITGGEPLIERNTFRVLEDLQNNPRPDLQVDINSNCCIPEKGLEQYLDIMKDLLANRKIKSSTLYTSVDGHGRQAEYGRTGLDYQKWYNTVDRVLTELPDLRVSIMCTSNVFSITSFKKLLEDVLFLRKKHITERRNTPIVLDISLLRWPGHQRVTILPEFYRTFLISSLDFMKENQERTNGNLPYEGFFDHEISKMERFIEFVSAPSSEIKQNQIPSLRKDFYMFVNEHDRRRGTNFLETFPELEEFYMMCKAEHDNRII